MKLKYAPLISLLILSCANALTISIDSDEAQIGGLDNLTINYLISLDSESTTSYKILLLNEYNEFLVYNSTDVITVLDNTITYNVTNVASGDYSLALELSEPLEYTVKSSTNVTVLKDLDLQVTVPNIIYVKGDEETVNITLYNQGNTDLSISSYFKNAKSDITITPQSFQLTRGAEKVIQVTVKKPTEDYDTTLAITSIDNKDETRNEYQISVIIPTINLELSDVNLIEAINETTITALINNTGNIDVNATVSIRTFHILEGFVTEEELITSLSDEAINYSLTIPKKIVLSAGITYFNGDENVTVVQELNPLNFMPFNFKLSSERLILIGALIGVIILIAFFKIRRKRRP